jgi:Transposase IS116/IS110/IS902 family
VQIKALDRQERHAVAQLQALVDQSGSTLGELCGLSTRSVAELLVEVGDVRRFTEGGFACFNGSASLPARDRRGAGRADPPPLHPGGNRRINAILHRMAITQLRREPRAQRIYANARAGGHKEGSPPNPQATPLRRHLPAHDSRPGHPARRSTPPGCITVRGRRAVKDCPTGPSAASRAAESLTAIGDRAPPCRQGEKLDIGAFLRRPEQRVGAEPATVRAGASVPVPYMPDTPGCLPGDDYAGSL